MISLSASDKQFFDTLVDSEALRGIKASFEPLFPQGTRWWVSSAVSGRSKKNGRHVRESRRVWEDSTSVFSHKISQGGPSLLALRKPSKESAAFFVKRSFGKGLLVAPFLLGDRVIGTLGIEGFVRPPQTPLLKLLTCQTALAVELCQKNEEVKKLSASIRPRAIALSTVHTVHRIINSTLNLDELVSRLAHLTAQVLRANQCAIYLMEEASVSRMPLNSRSAAPQAIICRARVGFPKKNRAGQPVRLKLGSGTEGKVAQTAKIILRKNFIVVPLIDEDVIGVMRVSHRKDAKEFTTFDQEILTTLAEEAVIAIKNAQLYEEQKKVTLGTIQSLAVILGTRVENVVAPEIFLRIALKMAEELKLGEDQTQALHYATLLKDTAKIGIPDDILKKPTKLTGEEYRLLREHPMKGAKIVQSFESLRSVVPIILYSREKYDGTGYPKGLKGEKIPIAARILCLINAFEAIVIGRPYRDRSTLEEALDEISRNSGTQFDPKVVEVFLKVIKKEGFQGLLKRVNRKIKVY